eukprot:839396-Pyramimonas_sp.AAC.1
MRKKDGTDIKKECADRLSQEKARGVLQAWADAKSKHTKDVPDEADDVDGFFKDLLPGLDNE